METQTIPNSSVLSFKSSARPARIAGILIFLSVLIVYYAFENVQLFIPIIAFCFMLVAVLFAADTSISADNDAKTLTIIKKRIIGSSKKEYQYKDIVYLYQIFETITDTKGQAHQKITYSVSIRNSDPARGQKLFSIPIPTGFYTMFSATVKEAQEYARARELATFMGINLMSKGGPHDSAANFVEQMPGIIDDISKIPETMKEAKKENERRAQEILQNQKK